MKLNYSFGKNVRNDSAIVHGLLAFVLVGGLMFSGALSRSSSIQLLVALVLSLLFSAVIASALGWCFGCWYSNDQPGRHRLKRTAITSLITFITAVVVGSIIGVASMVFDGISISYLFKYLLIGASGGVFVFITLLPVTLITGFLIQTWFNKVYPTN